jgi:Uma2 family endonuclease
MSDHLSVGEYLQGAETMRRRELEWGVVREPPAPLSRHQLVVTRLACQLEWHVRPADLGLVLVAPVDVILDAERGLVVQPDVIFITAARRSIVRGQVWGAPDLVVEVLSPGTARRDRTRKLDWYSRYGVSECWLADPAKGRIDVHALGDAPSVRVYRSTGTLRSGVLPALKMRVGDVFDA